MNLDNSISLGLACLGAMVLASGCRSDTQPASTAEDLSGRSSTEAAVPTGGDTGPGPSGGAEPYRTPSWAELRAFHAEHGQWLPPASGMGGPREAKAVSKEIAVAGATSLAAGNLVPRAAHPPYEVLDCSPVPHTPNMLYVKFGEGLHVEAKPDHPVLFTARVDRCVQVCPQVGADGCKSGERAQLRTLGAQRRATRGRRRGFGGVGCFGERQSVARGRASAIPREAGDRGDGDRAPGRGDLRSGNGVEDGES